MPQNPNPDGTHTTTLDDVIVTGRRMMFSVSFQPPAGELPTDISVLQPDIEPPAPPQLAECEKETLKDRAALEAAERLNELTQSKEWGVYIIRNPDGSLRVYGPIEGTNSGGGQNIPWNATKAELGISSWSQVVGLVHTHPGVGESTQMRRQFSPNDVQVTTAFLNAGADSGFRQYIVIDGKVYEYGQEKDAGDISTDLLTGQNQC